MNVSRESSPAPIGSGTSATPAQSGSEAGIVRQVRGQPIDAALAETTEARVHSPSAASSTPSSAGNIRRQSGEAGGTLPAEQHEPQRSELWSRAPRTLGELTRWRELSLLSFEKGSLERQFGEQLRDLQESCQTGRIDLETFVDDSASIEGRLLDLADEEKIPDLTYRLVYEDLMAQNRIFALHPDSLTSLQLHGRDIGEVGAMALAASRITHLELDPGRDIGEVDAMRLDASRIAHLQLDP